MQNRLSSVNYVNASCITKTFPRVISLSWFEFSAIWNDLNGCTGVTCLASLSDGRANLRIGWGWRGSYLWQRQLIKVKGTCVKTLGVWRQLSPALPPVLHVLYLWCFQCMYVLLPTSGKKLVQSAIWTHYLKLMMMYFTVLYHTLSVVWLVRSDAVKSSWWVPLFWRHHKNSSPASIWDCWWKDEPCLSQFRRIAFTGLDGAPFCPLLCVTTVLSTHVNLKRASVFLRIVGIYLEGYTVSEPRTSQWEDKCQFSSMCAWYVICIVICVKVLQKQNWVQ